MSISYEIIPWDCEGFNMPRRQFPTVNALTELVQQLGPADSFSVWEDGKERLLTEEERAEFLRIRVKLGYPPNYFYSPEPTPRPEPTMLQEAEGLRARVEATAKRY